MRKRSRIGLHLAAAVAVGIVVWGGIYLPLVNGCCEAIEQPLLIVFSPAIIVGSFVAGGLDRAGYVAALVGIIVEVIAIWGVAVSIWALQKAARGANGV